MLEEYQKAKKLLLKKLAIKSYPREELKSWLEEKGIAQDTVYDLLEEFQKLGYIDDAAWLEAFVRSQRNRRYGPRAIAAKLKQKGFSSQQIASAICCSSAICCDDNESQLIEELLKTRYSSRNLSDPHQKQKVIASLMRRGFSLEKILTSLTL